ncbi:MAG: PQQ-binding-like beta-propeller repeat protein [Firmicutes bacterium]|nr:PQQ-binding-like beta-propeller repeat protein [Bacillota bacterium]
MKVVYAFKVIITTLLVIAFTVSLAACKEAPAVEEQVVEGQATFETPPAEEEQKEEIPPLQTALIPQDKEVGYNLGTVTITTWNPVTIGPLENSTNLYFIAKNTGQQVVNLQFKRMESPAPRTTPGFPDWLSHFFMLFPNETFTLQPGESKTLEFYASMDLFESMEAKGVLNFKFILKETGQELTIPLTIVARTQCLPWRGLESLPASATITGKVTAIDGTPVEARIRMFLLNKENVTQLVNSHEGYFRIDVPSIEDIRAVLGPRQLPYSSIDYFLVAEAEGYEMVYQGGIAPSRGQIINMDIVLKPVNQQVSYSLVGEIATDGHFGYWWVRFAGNGDKVVAVQGQHDQSSLPGHIIAISLSGQELWRIPTRKQCWGFDVSSDGKLIAASDMEGFLYMIDENGHLLWEKQISNGNVRNVQFSPDGSYVYSAGFLFETESGREVWNIPGNPGEYNSRWSPDGNRIVASQSGIIIMLNREGKVLWRSEQSIGIDPLFLQIDADYNIYAAGKSRELFSFDGNGKLRWRQKLAQTPNNMNRAMSANGKLIVTHIVSGMLEAFNNTGEVLWRRPLSMDAMYGPGHQGIDVTPDGELIAVAGNWSDQLTGSLLLYNCKGTLLWKHEAPMNQEFNYTGHFMGAQSVSISDDSSYIVVGYADSVIRIFKRER